jgi:subtilisin-like proprotein convertase family protein
MRIRFEGATPGLHPEEIFATVKTLTGPQEVIVDSSTRRAGYIDVGNPVAHHAGRYLVELPSETASGAWRVWVDDSVIVDEPREAAE